MTNFLPSRRAWRGWLAVGLLALLVAGCARQPRDGAHEARRTILKAQLSGLTELAAALRDSVLSTRNQALISMDQELLQQLVRAALPLRRQLGGNIVVDVDSAWVQCQEGLALVRLAARASLGGDSTAAAEMTIHAALRQVDFDPTSGLLSGRIEVISSETRRVRFMGMDRSMRDLIRTVSHLRLDALAPLNYTLEIPLRLADAVRLPEIGADGGDIHIPAATIPLRVAIRPVMAFRGRLWIPVELGVPREGTPPFAVAPPAAPAVHERKGWSNRLPWRQQKLLLADYEARHAEVERLIQRDAYLSSPLVDSASVGLALPITLVSDILSAVAARYLDEVTVTLPAGRVTVHESGDMRVSTFLGRMTAARWTVALDPLTLAGTLSAGEPTVTRAPGTNRLHLVLPVTLRDGRGSGRLAFHWDPHGLANLACSTFDRTLPISGTLVARTYPVRGDFVLAADGDHLTADPDFPPDRFTMSVEPGADTWRRVREELEAQDQGKCGLFFDSATGLARLKELCAEGFKVKLPRGIFRPVLLPASFQRAVTVAGRPVRLALRPGALRITPRLCWYTAEVEVGTAADDTLGLTSGVAGGSGGSGELRH